MSVWRKKALECLPERRSELQQPDISLYEIFSILRHETILAHQEGDNEKLKKYYGFAAWCLAQKEKHIWNPAGVSFYEHLGDREETLREMPKWVNKSIYIQIRVLLELQLTETALLKLDKAYGQ